jgi:hypothetical protein
MVRSWDAILRERVFELTRIVPSRARAIVTLVMPNARTIQRQVSVATPTDRFPTRIGS